MSHDGPASATPRWVWSCVALAVVLSLGVAVVVTSTAQPVVVARSQLWTGLQAPPRNDSMPAPPQPQVPLDASTLLDDPTARRQVARGLDVDPRRVADIVRLDGSTVVTISARGDSAAQASARLRVATTAIRAAQARRGLTFDQRGVAVVVSTPAARRQPSRLVPNLAVAAWTGVAGSLVLAAGVGAAAGTVGRRRDLVRALDVQGSGSVGMRQ